MNKKRLRGGEGKVGEDLKTSQVRVELSKTFFVRNKKDACRTLFGFLRGGKGRYMDQEGAARNNRNKSRGGGGGGGGGSVLGFGRGGGRGEGVNPFGSNKLDE